MPKRIQRKRTKGWRMPEGVVYVGRPTIFGNPFATWDSPFDLYRWWLTGVEGKPELMARLAGDKQPTRAEWRVDLLMGQRRVILVRMKELRGKDLCCWCPLDKPCHADVLLEIANA